MLCIGGKANWDIGKDAPRKDKITQPNAEYEGAVDIT
jgi:hypothetical protein